MYSPGLNADDLERLLAEREKIATALRENEKALLDRHTREQTVMFTDIVGSTRYFEEKGDVEGMKLLHRHNELLFPVVERHRGRIIKTIGDAILATFESPEEGVRAAMQMHQTLREANNRGDGPQIHIRAGLHHGRVFLANNDIFGDTVNTSARVVHAAGPDEVLVSQYLYSKIPKTEPLVVTPRGTLALKGKAEPFPVVAVDWQEASTSGEFSIPASASGKAPELFVLDIAAGANGLKVSVIDGDADKGTVKAYGEQKVSIDELTDSAKTFATFMHAGGAGSYVPRIRAEGEALFNRALSERAKRHLKETKLAYLRLHLDDALVQVPWELMHDGKEFLGVRFALGRNVAAKTEETVAPVIGAQSHALPPSALVVANPSGDLPSALKEGEAIEGLLKEGYAGKVTLLRGPVKKGDFLGALKGCTVLHFAGHIEQPREGAHGGFVLADGIASPSEVRKAVGETVPGLVFANGCHATSGRGFAETARGVSDLASALLIRGCRHFIGPSFAVNDADALTFALRFYEKALAQVPFGEAARQARGVLLEPGHQPLSFAGYVLYGDPRNAFSKEHSRLSAKLTRSLRDSAENLDISRLSAMTNTTQAQAAFAVGGAPKPQKKMKPAGVVAIAGGIAVALAAILTRSGGGGESESKKPPEPQQQQVANAQPEVVLPKVVHEGPIRLTVLPFKNVSADATIKHLEEGLAESITTDFSGEESIRLIERGQIGQNLAEIDFGKGEYVDKATRAEIGKINGAEVAVLGGYQRAGNTLRANARFVNVETGEVLHAVKVEKPADQLLDLQDAVAAELKSALPSLKSKLRP